MRTHGPADGAAMTVQDATAGAVAPAAAVDVRAAAVAWEELFRAQVAIMRRLQRDPIWDRITLREYDVLFTLSRAPEGLRLRDLGESSLLSQPSLSRMVERLEEGGWARRRRRAHRRGCGAAEGGRPAARAGHRALRRRGAGRGAARGAHGRGRRAPGGPAGHPGPPPRWRRRRSRRGRGCSLNPARPPRADGRGDLRPTTGAGPRRTMDVGGSGPGGDRARPPRPSRWRAER